MDVETAHHLLRKVSFVRKDHVEVNEFEEESMRSALSLLDEALRSEELPFRHETSPVRSACDAVRKCSRVPLHDLPRRME